MKNQSRVIQILYWSITGNNIPRERRNLNVPCQFKLYNNHNSESSSNPRRINNGVFYEPL
jgi:hypothetical protein